MVEKNKHEVSGYFRTLLMQSNNNLATKSLYFISVFHSKIYKLI